MKSIKLIGGIISVLLYSCERQEALHYSVPAVPWGDLTENRFPGVKPDATPTVFPPFEGSHRAIIEVKKSGEAAYLNFEWRRHDREVDKHRFIIVNESTRDTVKNIYRIEVTSVVIGAVTGELIHEVIESGSSWYLASKIDKDELFAPVTRRFITTSIVLILLFVSLASGAFLVMHYRRRHFYGQIVEEERKQAALKAHFEYIVNYANDIFFLEDEQLNIIEANHRAQQTYQYSLEEFRKIKLTDLVQHTSDSLIEEHLKSVTLNDGAISESIHLRKDGSPFDVEVRSRIIKNDKRYFHQIIRDITERKKAESMLRESEERFRTTMYSTGDGIITTDIKGQIVHMNRVAENLTGWMEGEASGKFIKEVFNPHCSYKHSTS